MRSGFLRYCIRRLLQLVPVMRAISVVNFILIRVAPGDPALYLVGATQATTEVYQQLRTEFGLDRSLIAARRSRVTVGDRRRSLIGMRVRLDGLRLTRLALHALGES